MFNTTSKYDLEERERDAAQCSVSLLQTAVVFKMGWATFVASLTLAVSEVNKDTNLYFVQSLYWNNVFLQGRQFDRNGNLVDWWQEMTKQKYLEKAKCIIDQYSNYTVKEVSLKVPDLCLSQLFLSFLTIQFN